MSIQTEISESAAIRAQLSHPVMDVDAHTSEHLPAYLAYVDDEGGPKAVDRLRKEFAAGVGPTKTKWYDLSPEERRRQRPMRPSWWVATRNTRDYAASTIPAYFHQRMEEFGLDYSIMFPGVGTVVASIDDEELRRVACRAINIFYADECRGLEDRLCPVAVIPMHTPEEAIDELRHAVRDLGHKVVTPAGSVRRHGGEEGQAWLDTFALDSIYDYDPVWAECVALKVCPMFHSSGRGWNARASISSYMYNHIGHFADAGEALCKSLFFGGVTRRFPTFRAGFMEGGVAWGARLYCDLASRWKKRGGPNIARLAPDALDAEAFASILDEFGGDVLKRRPPENEGLTPLSSRRSEAEDDLDEFARCEIESVEDIRDLFVPHFAFGCEADDPLNVTAFAPGLPLDAHVTALFGSDIGHWDVTDARGVVAEAYEMVEDGLFTPEQFRDFVFVNPVRFFGEVNPDFFTGTVLQTAAAELGIGAPS